MAWDEFYVGRVGMGRVGFGPSCPAPKNITSGTATSFREIMFIIVFRTLVKPIVTTTRVDVMPLISILFLV